MSRKPKTEMTARRVMVRAQRLGLFGPSHLLEGEDAVAYGQLIAGICAAIKPVDLIDEILINDASSSQLEVLRYRRSKWSLIRGRALEALEVFLEGQLDQDMCSEHFVARLTEILQDYLPEDQANSLAQQCALKESHALETIDKILADSQYDADTALCDAKARKASELVQGYLRREPNAMTLVDKLLTEAGLSIETFMAEALAKKLDKTERLDRLLATAESRRNASLREIDRRRAVLGEALRRSVQEIEDGQFEEIETTPAKEKTRLDE